MSKELKQYAIKLIKQKEYKTRAQKQLKEFEQAFVQSKQAFLEQDLGCCRVPVGSSASVIIRKKVTTVQGTFTQRRLENFMTEPLSAEAIHEAAEGVQRELQEMAAKEREKQEKESRKRERQETAVKRKEEREARKVAKAAMESRVAQVKRMIQEKDKT
jgi:hypothetical protein